MKVVIAGGTGFIGQFMVKRYLKQSHSITVIGRSQAKIQHCFQKRVEAIDWENFHQQGHQILSNCDLLINLAGTGIADKRWTKRRKQLLLESRIVTTQHLVRVCLDLKERSPPLFSASAVGIYGIQTPQATYFPPPFTETSHLSSNTSLFSVDLVKRWEAETQRLRAQGTRVVNLRFGVVLGKHGGALQRLKWIFQWGLGGKIASGRQPFSWIHIEDLCRAIDFLLPCLTVNGPVNLVAPECVSQQTLAKLLGHTLHRPTLLSTPAFVLKSLYGQMAEELLINGQHVTPQILKKLNFHFKYPSLKPALESIF